MTYYSNRHHIINSYVYYILRNIHAYRCIRTFYRLSSVKHNMNSTTTINIYTCLNYYIHVCDILCRLTSINIYTDIIYTFKFIKLYPVYLSYTYMYTVYSNSLSRTRRVSLIVYFNIKTIYNYKNFK